MKKITLNKRTVANFSAATVLDQHATQHIGGASIDGSAHPGQETWACPVTTSAVLCYTMPRTFIQQR